MVKFKEQVIQFNTHQNRFGIFTDTEDNNIKKNVAALLLNAGGTHKIGPNRLYVKMARELINISIPSFRFDFSGIGDNQHYTTDLTFEKYQIDETIASMDEIQAIFGIQSFILIGMCSGAVVAFETAKNDDRVIAIVMVNGFRLEGTNSKKLSPIVKKAIALQYYKNHFFDYNRWLKVLTGKSKIIQNIRKSKNQYNGHKSNDLNLSHERNGWDCLLEKKVKIKLILADGSLAYNFFKYTLANYLQCSKKREKFELEIVKNTDHNFTPIWSQKLLLSRIKEWCKYATDISFAWTQE